MGCKGVDVTLDRGWRNRLALEVVSLGSGKILTGRLRLGILTR